MIGNTVYIIVFFILEVSKLKEALTDLKFILLLGKGYVKFSLSDSKRHTIHYFQIQEFRKPEYVVSSMIQLPIAYYCHPTIDQCVIVTCEGKLFSGGYLNDANVQWTLQAKTTKFTPANRSDYIFGTTQPFYSYIGNHTQNKISYPKKYFQVI